MAIFKALALPLLGRRALRRSLDDQVDLRGVDLEGVQLLSVLDHLLAQQCDDVQTGGTRRPASPLRWWQVVLGAGRPIRFERREQEYCCIPGDDNAAFLSYDLIASCEYREGEAWQTSLAETRNPLYVGVDVGRDRDLTVIWVIEKISDAKFTRRVIELDRRSFEEQEATLYAILALPAMRRCCIDQTGLGRQFAERAIQRFGEYKVEGLHFTGPVKEELAYPVRAAFEDRSIRIPHDPKIRADLRGIKKETTAAGNIRFVAERDANGHCDRFWALALAIHAGKNPGGNLTGESISMRAHERAGRPMARTVGGML